MKKFLLSTAVVMAFGLYVLGLRHKGDDEEVAVTPPANLSTNPAPTATPTPSNNSAASSTPPPSSPTTGQYKDGTYTGTPADAFYGLIQVKVTIQNGSISDVQFLQYPSDRSTSMMINSQAMPYLKQEAIQAQSANVATVSGATDSSGAFRQSLASALSQAH